MNSIVHFDYRECRQSRRALLQAGAGAIATVALPGGARAAVANPADHIAPPEKQHAWKPAANGLMAPEGPKAMADGTVLVGEMARGTLSRVTPATGEVKVVANLLGSPNGTAVGPDNAAYVTNNGGGQYHREGDLLLSNGIQARPPTGAIQRVDLATGHFTTLYSVTDGMDGANDIAFDPWGTLWFTDPASGSLWWGKADGSQLVKIAPVPSANGIAFSPDWKTLYVVSSQFGKVASVTVHGPGEIERRKDGSPIVNTAADFPGTRFDSMGMEADGTLVVGTLFAGCLTLITPQGKLRDQVFLPDSFITNVTFGGPGMRTAYATMTRMGKLAAIDWPRPGMKIANY
jgi:gluconolactonase